MPTGIELIAQERKEQIEKHGYTTENDKNYIGGQLVSAAIYCLTKDTFMWPKNWSENGMEKIARSHGIQALKKAGAFLAAEIDRLQFSKNSAKIYIGGKITGLPIEECWNNFLQQEIKFQQRGYEVVNPLRIHGINSIEDFKNHKTLKHEEYLKKDFEELLKCDYANFQDNWEDSTGARLEYGICVACKIRIFTE